MLSNKKIIAIIPARGGSKGLPGKNIIPLCGKPLINYTIEAALKVDYIDTVMVSTDNYNIAQIAKNAGAEIPFIRPSSLATDTATSFDVVLNCIKWYKIQNITYDYFILLQPTSPLRTYEDINLAVDLLITKKAKAIVSVCESDHHPFWMNTLPLDQNMNFFEKQEYANIGRQQLPIFYRFNGAIYLSEVNYFLEQQSFLGAKTYALIMDKMHSIDIDDHLDLKFAEFLMKNH